MLAEILAAKMSIYRICMIIWGKPAFVKRREGCAKSLQDKELAKIREGVCSKITIYNP